MEPSSKTWTVGSLLTWASNDFTSKGHVDARLAAEVLLAKALNTNRVGLYLKFEETASEPARATFRTLVEERRKGMPVAYILGEKEFYSLTFSVDARVLIPRPETELMVDEALTIARLGNLKICDVGTGSGAIAIAIKKNLPETQVTGIDISADALQVARANADKHGVDIEWIESDLLTGAKGPFDLVTANLPYLSTAEHEQLSSDVRDFEPKGALVSGETGFELIEKLVKQVSSKVILEIGFGQEEGVRNLLSAAGFTIRSVRKDYAGIPRTIVAEK